MGKFHDLMDRDLQIRGYSLSTRKVYLARVRGFVRFFMSAPDLLAIEDIKRYLLDLTQVRRVSWSSFNQTVCALRFFYSVTLEKDWDIQRIPYQKTGRKLPQILSREEVETLLGALDNLKHRALLTTIYSGGLRLQEVLNLRISDIDSERMVIRVEQGKNRKDRYVMLSEELLPTLRQYWKAYRPDHWLFPGQDPSNRLNPSSVQRVFKKAKKIAGITKPVTVHSLRHSFASHLLEDGTNIRVIQKLLGHKSVRSTEIYTHVASNYVNQTRSPLDHCEHRRTPVPSDGS